MNIGRLSCTSSVWEKKTKIYLCTPQTETVNLERKVTDQSFWSHIWVMITDRVKHGSPKRVRPSEVGPCCSGEHPPTILLFPSQVRIDLNVTWINLILGREQSTPFLQITALSKAGWGKRKEIWKLSSTWMFVITDCFLSLFFLFFFFSVN